MDMFCCADDYCEGGVECCEDPKCEDTQEICCEEKHVEHPGCGIAELDQWACTKEGGHAIQRFVSP